LGRKFYAVTPVNEADFPSSHPYKIEIMESLLCGPASYQGGYPDYGKQQEPGQQGKDQKYKGRFYAGRA